MRLEATWVVTIPGQPNRQKNKVITAWHKALHIDTTVRCTLRTTGTVGTGTSRARRSLALGPFSPRSKEMLSERSTQFLASETYGRALARG